MDAVLLFYSAQFELPLSETGSSESLQCCTHLVRNQTGHLLPVKAGALECSASDSLLEAQLCCGK